MSAVHQFARIGQSQLHRRLLARGEGRAAVREGGRQSGQAVRTEHRRACSGTDSDEETIRELKRAYRLFFRSELNVSQASERAQTELEPLPEVQELLRFVEASERGVVI